MVEILLLQGVDPSTAAVYQVPSFDRSVGCGGWLGLHPGMATRERMGGSAVCQVVSGSRMNSCGPCCCSFTYSAVLHYKHLLYIPTLAYLGGRLWVKLKLNNCMTVIEG